MSKGRKKKKGRVVRKVIDVGIAWGDDDDHEGYCGLSRV